MTPRLFRNGYRTAITAVCLCLPTIALADRAPADVRPGRADLPQRSAPLPLQIAEDAAAPAHRIVIPKAVLAKLAGDLPGAAHIASVPPVRSIVAAIALSAAVACGLVASRRGRPGRIAAALLCGLTLACGLLVGGPAVADLAVPDREPLVEASELVQLAGKAAPDSVTLGQGGKVILEIGAEGDAVVLVVGKAAPAKKK